MPSPNLNSDDYYSILGCDRGASDTELKKAYRKLAVKWHPDKNPDNEIATRNFQKISEAYATLSDPSKRKLYDMYGKEGANAAENMPQAADGCPTGGFPGRMHFSSHGGMPGSSQMTPEDAQAFFSSIFGGSDPFGGAGFFGGNGKQPGGGIHMNIGGIPSTSVGSIGSGGMDPFSMMFAGGMPGTGSMSGGMPRRQQFQKKSRSFNSIPLGTVVSLKGLILSSEHNGDQGVIKSYNSLNGRYIIVLEDTNESMSVKSSNILQHIHVKIHGLKSQTELNGKKGTIVTWLPTKERYNIYIMASKKIFSLKPTNIILEVGSVGQIYGLMSKPQLNGKWGTIIYWIQDSNKYDVQLSETQIIRIKVENLRV